MAQKPRETPKKQTPDKAEKKTLTSDSFLKEKPQVAAGFRPTSSAPVYQPTTASLYREEDKVIREDIVDGKRIITKVKVIKNGITTEYMRVNYNWGGTFYFRNSTQSISPNLFACWTGVGY